MKRTVKDVMTTDVITVQTSTAYKDVVRLLEVSGISAAPVLDDAGRLAGILSEADLLLKEEYQDGKRPRFERARHRVERDKAAGMLAWQLMSSPVVTTRPDETVAAAARTMHARGVKRLPVLDADGTLVGIVSRRDLLSIFMRPDDEIHREIVHDVMEKKLWLSPAEARVNVTVSDGAVTLDGWVDRKSMVEIIVGMVHGVEGVVGVENRTHYEEDDTKTRPFVAAPWGVLPYSLRRP